MVAVGTCARRAGSSQEAAGMGDVGGEAVSAPLPLDGAARRRGGGARGQQHGRLAAGRGGGECHLGWIGVKDSPQPLLCFLVSVEEAEPPVMDGWFVARGYQDEVGTGGVVPTWRNLLPFVV